MALSAAERAKRYRERKKADPESRANFLQKESERQRKRYVPINERSKRQQRHTRRSWKRTQRTHRTRVAELQALIDTPPQSPNDTPRQRGRKKVRRERAKVHRDNKALKVKIISAERKLERYKKRYQRATSKLNSSRGISDEALTSQSSVRKELMFGRTLIQQMRANYNDTKEQQLKRLFARFTRGRILKKYRMLEHAREVFSIHTKSRALASTIGLKRRKRPTSALNQETLTTIHRFYERDDNSRMQPGKKDTLTRKGEKKQKRLLTETIKALHAKFRFEYPNLPICYSTFCTARPFWVVFASMKDRDTCLCKTHENAQLIATKLHREKAIASADLKSQYLHLVCNTENKKCMYGQCETCHGQRLPELPVERNDEEITYQQWVSTTEERTKTTAGNGDEKISVRVTRKDSVTTSLYDLYNKFEDDLKPRVTRHVFNIQHQYQSLRSLRDKIDYGDAIVHMDFSENYAGKFHSEVQSVHFGGSHQQVSLHTGVMYKKDQNPLPFCSISSNTRHDPAGIWSHLLPVLRDNQPSPEVSSSATLHFVSDGPTTQYRNKSNFYLASLIPFEMGYSKMYWNLLESSHGKGAPDGIGAVVKRTADQLVCSGKDINDAKTLFNCLVPKTSVKLYYIEDKEFREMHTRIPAELRPVPGTMTLHQLYCSGKHPEVLKCRVLSCYCQYSDSKEACACFDPIEHKLLNPTNVHGTAEEVPREQPQGISDQNGSKDKTQSPTSVMLQPNPSENLHDKWCVVEYDRKAYPGKIRDYDENSVEVMAMSAVGKNRFFWPARDDVIWYDYANVITMIPEPKKVTARHVEIAPEYWEAICEVMM